jgi:hypothetical protein
MKSVYVLLMVVFLALSATFSVSAQAEVPETISVAGVGSATAAPDLATVEIGVENVEADVQTAFAQTNDTLQAVIDQIVAAGVAQEDVRTVGLSIYTREDFGPTMMLESQAPGGDTPARRYSVSNRVRVVVRDLSVLEDVIGAAIDAGANNIFGPEFGFADRGELERQARENAMVIARERAGQLAEMAGVELGDILMIEESAGGFGPFDVQNLAMADMGVGSAAAVIEPGQLSVTVQLQVTFRMSR